MTFRLATFLYLFALIAAAIAVFGTSGLVVAAMVLGFWSVFFYLLWRGYAFVLIGAAMLLLIMFFMLHGLCYSLKSPGGARCVKNLRQLAWGVSKYESATGNFPPVGDKANQNSVPCSWRVLILPQIDQQSLFDAYNFAEPWDGPSNRKQFAHIETEVYECPESDVACHTNYFAVTGPQTIWGDGEPRTLREATDGASNTILLIEAAGRGVHWTEPVDLTFEQALELLTTPLPADSTDGHIVDYGYFRKPGRVRGVAMADCRVRGVPVPIPRDLAVALLTANGGETFDENQLDAYYSGGELDYGQIWGVVIFVVLALMPGVPAIKRRIWPEWVNQPGAVSVEHGMPVE
ncbi:DUF1559 family PulG-like putative transporter [Aeoliella mucimassa]|uniref:DUF1559 domain-containing protein n=1 Tax=Aeoliella mucimassa TaxID=2527972 RepID=A0A518AWE5_9BACT|nr:DUF1559 domain-containing protein [Aeoliella mucimassa]QDU59043.1 hypothetical protein Pan181_52840 [Aeoliella mucimassa]